MPHSPHNFAVTRYRPSRSSLSPKAAISFFIPSILLFNVTATKNNAIKVKTAIHDLLSLRFKFVSEARRMFSIRRIIPV
jgi:hypothetical protein